MSATVDEPDPLNHRNARFQTTRWSMILASQRSESKETANALATLCEQYWPPLYAFVRYQGHSVQDAQDLTQSFFTRLLEKNWLATADQKQGRFRTFLLTAMKRFLANEWDRDRALKRGGAVKLISMDFAIGMTISDPKSMAGDQVFDRQWALAMLAAVMLRLQTEFASAGRTSEYELLKPCLTAPRNGTNYDALAEALGVQPVSARSAVHRLRKRFKEIFREEVMLTVADSSEIEDELRAVIAALSVQF